MSDTSPVLAGLRPPNSFHTESHLAYYQHLCDSLSGREEIGIGTENNACLRN